MIFFNLHTDNIIICWF